MAALKELETEAEKPKDEEAEEDKTPEDEAAMEEDYEIKTPGG